MLPDQALVQQWFDMTPNKCRCGKAGCRGLRWNPRADHHLGREGHVLRIDASDDTVLVGMVGRCNCKLWYPRLAVEPVYDPDMACKLRFQVGTRVECKMTDDAWLTGTIDQLWWRPPDWNNRPTAPYRVKLDDGSSITVPFDANQTVRLVASSKKKGSSSLMGKVLAALPKFPRSARYARVATLS